MSLSLSFYFIYAFVVVVAAAVVRFRFDVEGWFAMSFGNKLIENFASQWRAKQKGKTAINYCDNVMLLLYGKWSASFFSVILWELLMGWDFHCHSHTHRRPTAWLNCCSVSLVWNPMERSANGTRHLKISLSFFVCYHWRFSPAPRVFHNFVLFQSDFSSQKFCCCFLFRCSFLLLLLLFEPIRPPRSWAVICAGVWLLCRMPHTCYPIA